MAKTIEIGPYSAYAIAVANGYDGTEEEWLASLVGPRGAQGASITGVKIDGNEHIIVTIHDPATNTDTTIDAGPIDNTSAVQSIQQAAQEALQQVAASTETAQTAATQAAESASNAATSAQTATEQANAAGESAGQAANSASSAGNSAMAAAGSASAAKTSETNAASSAAAAQASEDKVHTDATAATEAAEKAAASEQAAATSESNAAESAEQAQASETEAAESATQAAASQTAASESATQAQQAASEAQSAAGEIDAGIIVESASGEVISVSDSANAKLRGLHLYGKSVQDGTPTPEAPVEIESAGDGGNIGVKIQGKNLIYTVSSGSSNGVTMTANEDGTFTLNGTAVNSAAGLYFVGNYNTTNVTYPDAKYSFKVDGLQESDTTIIRGPSRIDFPGAYNAVLTYNGIISQVGIRLIVGHTYDNTIIKPMLIAGENMPDEFIPGSAPQTLTYPIPNGLPGIQVESGGNYTDAKGQQWVCDEVDFGRGKYVQRIGKITLTGDMSWYYNVPWDEAAPDVFHYYVNLTNKKVDTQNGANNTLCTHFECKTVGGSSLINTECIYSLYSVQTIYVFLDKSRANTPDLEGFKGWINQNQPVIYYILQYPIETDLTPEQLTAYAALTTYKPNTTVTTDSDPAAGIEVNYVADTKTYIDNKLAAISGAILGGTKNGNV